MLDPERRAVRVTISPPSSSAREIDLDLPDEPACARLLRDPFQRAPSPPRARVDVSVTSNLVFAPNGGKLFARGPGSEILAYPVPTSSRVTPGRPKRYVPKSSGFVVAVGWLNRMIVMLIFDKGHLRFELPNGKRLEHLRVPIPVPEDLGFVPPGPGDPLALLAFKPYGPKLVPVTIDARRALYEISNDFDPPISRVVPEVAALAVVHDQIAFVGRDVSDDATIAGVPLAPREGTAPRAAGAWRLIVVGTKERPSAATLLERDGFSEAIYGFDATATAGAVLVAVRHEGTTWTIESSKRTLQLVAPSDVRVVGVHQARDDLGPELILLEANKRALSFLGSSSSRSLPRASSEIVHVAQCHSQAILAYATVTGEVVIHALGYDTPLARYLPREARSDGPRASAAPAPDDPPRRRRGRGDPRGRLDPRRAACDPPRHRRVGARRRRAPQRLRAARAPPVAALDRRPPRARPPARPRLRLARPPGRARRAALLRAARRRRARRHRPAPGAVLLVAGGVVRAVDDAAPIEPADLLDVSTFAPLAVTPLGAPPPAPAQRALALVSRGSFGVATAPPESALLLKALAQRKPAGPPRGSVRLPGDEQRDGAGLGLSIFMSFFAAVAALLARFAAPAPSSDPAPPRLPPARGSGAGSQRSLAAVPQEPRGPSLADRARAHDELDRARLVRARLARMIGQRQSEYLDQTMEMFERGDLAEALRRAVPLARDKDPDSLVIPALTVPTPRSALAISPMESQSATSMFASGDLFSHLRATYRKAFERLEREGRVDEAAFVLAELLHDNEEAVAFLERHGRLRLAAEIAEARGLPPGLVVRQWFLAGDTPRAVRHARRFGAFADALARLDKHESQPQLRLLWADMLADAGDFAAAIDVVWPLPREPAARRRVDRRGDHPGRRRGRAHARAQARARARAFAEVRDRALALLAESGDSAPPERIAFAQALLRAPPTPGSRTLARPAIRALIRDGARTAEPVVPGVVGYLVTYAADASLRADVPAWPVVTRAPLRAAVPARVISIAATDTGPSPIHDFVELPSGRALIALGEAGVRVLARDGRVLFHLDQPAHRLVISDRGDRALALAPAATSGASPASISRSAAARPGAKPLSTPSPPTSTARSGSSPKAKSSTSSTPSPPISPRSTRSPSTAAPWRSAARPPSAPPSSRPRRRRAGVSSCRASPSARASRSARPPSSGRSASASPAPRAQAARSSSASPCRAPPARPSVQIVFASETSANGTMLEIAPVDAAPRAVEVRPGFVAVVTQEAESAVVRLLDDTSLTCRAVITSPARSARERASATTPSPSATTAAACSPSISSTAASSAARGSDPRSKHPSRSRPSRSRRIATTALPRLQRQDDLIEELAEGKHPGNPLTPHPHEGCAQQASAG